MEESRSDRARRNGPATFDHLKKRQPRTKRVPFYMDDEVASHANEVAQKVAKWRTDPRTAKHDLPEYLQREWEEASADLEEVTIELVFQSIGRKAYEQLVADHPATDEQKAEAKEEDVPEPPYNTTTFPVHLIAASMVEPKLTVGQVEELFDEWAQPDLVTMFTAALEVNTQRRVVQMGEGSRPAPVS